MYKNILLVLIFLLITFLLYSLTKTVTYDLFSPYISNNSNYPYWDNESSYPFWNSQRSTRNMSYDLRGDVPIPYFMNLPFNMSSRVPIQNKTLSDIS